MPLGTTLPALMLGVLCSLTAWDSGPLTGWGRGLRPRTGAAPSGLWRAPVRRAGSLPHPPPTPCRLPARSTDPPGRPRPGGQRGGRSCGGGGLLPAAQPQPLRAADPDRSGRPTLRPQTPGGARPLAPPPGAPLPRRHQSCGVRRPSGPQACAGRTHPDSSRRGSPATPSLSWHGWAATPRGTLGPSPGGHPCEPRRPRRFLPQ